MLSYRQRRAVLCLGKQYNHIATARILRGYDRFTAMPGAEARDLDAAQFSFRKIWNIDV